MVWTGRCSFWPQKLILKSLILACEQFSKNIFKLAYLLTQDSKIWYTEVFWDEETIKNGFKTIRAVFVAEFGDFWHFLLFPSLALFFPSLVPSLAFWAVPAYALNNVFYSTYALTEVCKCAKVRYVGCLIIDNYLRKTQITVSSHITVLKCQKTILILQKLCRVYWTLQYKGLTHIGVHIWMLALLHHLTIHIFLQMCYKMARHFGSNATHF